MTKVIGEVQGFKKYYHPDQTMVKIYDKSLVVTTTSASTEFQEVRSNEYKILWKWEPNFGDKKTFVITNNWIQYWLYFIDFNESS